MKTLFSSLVLISMFSAAAQAANLTPVAPTLTATVTSLNVDGRESFANATGGNIRIDRQARKITLTLALPGPVCLPGQLCPMWMPAPVIIELPLVSVKPGICNSTVYAGKLDQRAVDGGLKMITVQDNTANTCESIMPFFPTDIVLKTMGARESYNEERTSTFEAEALQPLLYR
jgi:hypothetical protein